MTTITTIREGDFRALGLSDWDCEMLEDAYKAVTTANRWDFLRRKDVPGPNGFMFSDWPQMKDIEVFMEYGGHSGASFGMTMRTMEFIAKHGWGQYVLDAQENRRKREEEKQKQEEEKQKQQRATQAVNNLFRTSVAIDSALHQAKQQGVTDPVSFAEMMQANPQVRQVIPDIDQQASAMKRFAEGKMSYAEMRSLCG